MQSVHQTIIVNLEILPTIINLLYLYQPTIHCILQVLDYPLHPDKPVPSKEVTSITIPASEEIEIPAGGETS